MIGLSHNLDVTVEVVAVNGSGAASGVTYDVRPVEGDKRGLFTNMTPQRWFPGSVILDPAVTVGALGRVQSLDGNVQLFLTEHPRTTEC